MTYDPPFDLPIPGMVGFRTLQRSQAPMGGLDSAALVEPELVHYPSFDGLEIPAYYYHPTDRHRRGDAGSMRVGALIERLSDESKSRVRL